MNLFDQIFYHVLKNFNIFFIVIAINPLFYMISKSKFFLRRTRFHTATFQKRLVLLLLKFELTYIIQT